MGAIAIVTGWLLSNPIVGIVTWVGTILTVGGLVIAILQSVAARRSADRAERAVAQLKVRLDTANIAYASAELVTFLHMVRSGDFTLGLAFFAPIKRSLRLQSQSDPSRVEEIEPLNRAIGAIENHLNWGRIGDAKYKEAQIFRAVDGLMKTVTGWEGALARRQI
ncbi:hypothetical protein NMG46_20600 [Mesorhizobium sp. LMG 17147]|uniref:hypothetical protein n=1 Tax=Mesorhizobium sp. LMG 17147 TaxID=2963091 RepID=UPI0020C9A71F|nr:hypothetical protein [Mesorhizobium sp. LMG 17147]MCP9232633.1 hypothetical protein [Mesorhizobium sp. LMG 17147]